MAKQLLSATALALVLVACSGGGDGSNSGSPPNPNSDPNSPKATSLNVCRLKGSGDIVVAKFNMDLTSHGRDVYKSLFDAHKSCANTDASCLAKASGDINLYTI